jgi:hypothetical protein
MTFLDPSAYIQNTVDEIIAEYDPFVGNWQQTGRTKAYCRIWISSFDVNTAVEVTDSLEPHLISVHVTDGLSNHTCDIELDDRYGTLPIPPLWTPCVVLMGWRNQAGEEIFWGHIQDIQHGCARGQNAGRRLWITAKGENFNSPGKENQQDSLGEGAPPGESEGQKIPFPAAVQKFAQAAGHSSVINPQLQTVLRDHWEIANESFLNWSSRISEEMGVIFRVIKGTQAEYTVPGERADGTMNVLRADWGVNMIGWRVHPAAARPAWNESKQQFFDTRKAVWKGLTSTINSFLPGAASTAGYQQAGPAGNSSVAEQQANGTGNFINYSMEPGRVVIQGEPTAHAGYYVRISGARPGVDGVWWIFEVEHLYSRQGYITWLNVKYPTVRDAGAIVQRQLNDLGITDITEQAMNMAQAYSVDPNFLTGLIANSPGFTVSLQALQNMNLTPEQLQNMQLTPAQQLQLKALIGGGVG